MKKINLAVCLLSSIVTSTALASVCDNRQIKIIGPEYYRYTMKLEKGSFHKKGNNVKVVDEQYASPYGTDYYVFSAKGSEGNAFGTAWFTNLETKEQMSVTIGFYSTNNGICHVIPALQNAEAGNTQIQAKLSGRSDLVIKIREFK